MTKKKKSRTTYENIVGLLLWRR